MAQAMLVMPGISGHSVDDKTDGLLHFLIQRLSPRPSLPSILRRPLSSPTVALFKLKTKAPSAKKVDNCLSIRSLYMENRFYSVVVQYRLS